MREIKLNNRTTYQLMALLIAVLTLAGCATARKEMESMIGLSKANLVEKYGPPLRISSDGDVGEIYTYESRFVTRTTPISTGTVYIPPEDQRCVS